MMLGFLLARSGVRCVVLEKHGDFLRDFRGDTVHPSTLNVMDELGLLDEFLKLPHQKVSRINGLFGEERVLMADFSDLPVRTPFIAMMPQWDFLDFLAAQGKRFAGFTALMNAEATGLVEEGGRVVGVRATLEGKPEEIRADLVVGADGRHSTVREAAGLHPIVIGAPMDVLWFRLSRKPADSAETMGRFDSGSILVMLDRGELSPLLLAADLATPVETLTPDRSLRDALAAMNARGLDVLPVVSADGDRRYLGLLTRADLLAAYERALVHEV